MNGSSSSALLLPTSPPDHAFDKLLPKLVECFGVMLIGFFAGKLGLLTELGSKGLNYFAANFALPAMIFLNLAQLDASNVHWPFVSGILVGKLIIFGLVVVVVLIARRPPDLSKAAIYAIFATHVNDFGLAYPILQSVYGETHPVYPNYIYLIGLISLALLNPLGFLMIEVQKVRSESPPGNKPLEVGAGLGGSKAARSKSWVAFKMVLSIAKRIVTNPNVFMTFFGAMANIIFKGNFPDIPTRILKDFGDTFQGTVLFLLGLEVARTGLDKDSSYLLPGLLLTVKMLLSPLITRGTVKLFCSNLKEASSLEDYGFLYGTVPTAPVVLVYASQYGMPTQMLSVALVLCTLLSGPVMYVSARMLVVQAYDILEYMKQLRETILCLSSIGVFSCVWVVFLLVLSKRWKKPPHLVLLLLISAQAVMSIGLLVWASSPRSPWTNYLQMSAVTGGQLSCRFWSVILAIVLFLSPKYSTQGMRNLLPYFSVLGYGLPAVAVLCLLTTTHPDQQLFHGSDVVPSFLFGDTEACMAVIVLSFCLVTTSGCLLLFHRQRSQDTASNPVLLTKLSPAFSDSSVLSTIEEESARQIAATENEESNHSILCDVLCPVSFINNRDEREKSGKVETVASKRRKKPKKFEARPKETINMDVLIGKHFIAWAPLESEKNSIKLNDVDPEDLQCSRFFTILLFLCVSMIVGLTTSIWKLLAEERSGIFVALEFLDIILNFGQPILCALIFGRDLEPITTPIIKCWQKWKTAREQTRSFATKEGKENQMRKSPSVLARLRRYLCLKWTVTTVTVQRTTLRLQVAEVRGLPSVE